METSYPWERDGYPTDDEWTIQSTGVCWAAVLNLLGRPLDPDGNG